MKEHIETLEALACAVSEAAHPALDAAISLMRAAEPKDEAAEREHCYKVCIALRPLEQVDGLHWRMVDVFLRERAAARADGVMSQQSGVLDAMQRGLEQGRAEVEAKYAAQESEAAE